MDIKWITIPRGPFVMGAKEVMLYSYRISQYPITNAQFSAFVEATGRNWAPFLWKQEQFLVPDHPARFLTLLDAHAFCSWAECRLPTEAEWEKAARGPEGFEYPWGNDWKPNLCNGAGFRNRDTTPVWKFPNGASPYGIMDMVGNVGELTSSTMLIRDEQKDPYYREFPVVRGGDCTSSPIELRCTYRGIIETPNVVRDFVGFRVVGAG